MINGELRPTYLQTRGSGARGRSSATTIYGTCREWMRFARWLHERGITGIAACAGDEWRDYAAGRVNGVSRDHAVKILGQLTDLWAFDQLTACPSGITRPPWESEGADGYLPAAGGTAGGENMTEPIDPQVIGPLLVWAIRVVEDFSGDILAAWAENRRLTALAGNTAGSAAGKPALEAYLLPLVRSGSPLPAVSHKGTFMLARTFIAATTGASPAQLDRFQVRYGSLIALAARQPGPCPLGVPVTGQVNGRPWREYMDFGEPPELMRHLGTAAAVICLYLTGMRAQEVQGLRTGCCPNPGPGPEGGIPGRHLIRSRHYKNVTDADGNHVSAGEDREVPWVAIAPVVRAIRVLERIVPPGELLLSVTHHTFGIQHRRRAGALKAGSLNGRIEDFITWANREAARCGAPDQVIPEDPCGAIGTARFRRTLAWHITRRPGGLVALAIQYGHLRTVVSGGYASRGRSGIHDLIHVETVLAVADTVSGLRDGIQAGMGISGPAARFAIKTAVSIPVFAGKAITATTARRLLANQNAMIYDNPQALLLCHYKRDQALCHREGVKDTPSLHRCVPGCANMIRTDHHARQLRDRADALDKQAAHAPQPVADRLRATATQLRGQAGHHDRTRTVLDGAGQ
jgi:integrase